VINELNFKRLIDVQRRTWDTDEPAMAAERRYSGITGIELHHTGGAGPRSLSFADKQAWCLSIERYHEGNKGWRDIFYNVFVFADGEIWMGRNPLVPSQSSLVRWLTVHVPGSDPVLTSKQKASVSLLASAVGGHDKVRGHSERAATACPGNNTRNFIDELKRGEWLMSELEGIARFIQAVKDSGAAGFPGKDGQLYVWSDGAAVVKPAADYAGIAGFIQAVKDSGAAGFPGKDGQLYVWSNGAAVVRPADVVVDDVAEITGKLDDLAARVAQLELGERTSRAARGQLSARVAVVERKIDSVRKRVSANESSWSRLKGLFS